MNADDDRPVGAVASHGRRETATGAPTVPSRPVHRGIRLRALAAAPQAGAASLVVLLMMLGASLLLAAWSQRHVLTELRIAGNQVRRAAAFEAAEAGLAWAQAMLNQPAAIGADCRPSTASGGESFRTRHLAPPDEAGWLRPRPRTPAGTPRPRQMLCARGGSGWRCACPGADAATLTVAGDETEPSYLVEFAPAAAPGAIDVVATGCNHLARPCLPGAADRADAVVRLRVTLALLPALRTPPAAALTTRGDIDAGASSLGLYNADAASGGLAGHAGGRITGALRLRTAPGATRAAALLGGDEALAGLDATAFFARHFGVDPTQWALQPGVQTLSCPGTSCSAALRALAEGGADGVRVAMPGDQRLDGPVQIGRAERPVVLVVEGTLTLSGAVEFHGLVHARQLRWDDAGPGSGALLHGAALVEQDYGGNGAPDLVRSASVLRRLQQRDGSWVRVPGSWRDF